MWRVFSLERQDILVLSGTEDFRQGGKVDTEGNVAIAAVWGEAFCLEHHGDECDVGVVHGLERNTRVIAVEVAVLN